MSEPSASQYVCPNCSQIVELPPEQRQTQWTCPHCGGTFTIDSTQTEDDRADELDGVRIGQLARARRAANRSRSMCLVGALFCAVATVQLTINLVTNVFGNRMDWTTAAYLAAGALTFWGMMHLLAKARRLAAEAAASSLAQPDKPPDFTTLGDGSQRWKDLEKLK